MSLALIRVVSASTAILLLTVNLAGVAFLELRPSFIDNYVDFAKVETMPADEALAQLRTIQGADEFTVARKATQIIHETMVHVDPEDRATVGGRELHLSVPVWENYILWALRFVKADTYLDYEFCSYKRAVRRGVGRCGQQSLALVDYLSESGIATGFVDLGGHTLATADINGFGWILLDPDYGGVIPFDLGTAEKSPSVVTEYYWSDAALERRLWRLFGPEENVVSYGDARARWARACPIESVAYFLKWAVPCALLLITAWLYKWPPRWWLVRRSQ